MSKIQTIISNSLTELKDFQLATLDVINTHLIEGESKAMLVADEVGLGKTIIAKGVICKSILKKISEKRKSFKVVYICSNQIIAKENIHKLNPFPMSENAHCEPKRVAFLAYKPKKSFNNSEFNLEIISLTPNTSFDVSNSTGIKEERTVIYKLLMQDCELKKCDIGLKLLLKAGVSNLDNWKTELDNKCIDFRDGLIDSFLNKVKSKYVEIDSSIFCVNKKKGFLYDIILETAISISKETDEEEFHNCCIELIKHLRKILTDLCINYLEPDLYILDEFQRFKDLINPDSESEVSIVAQKAFNASSGTNILMLSATPFKIVSGANELEEENQHYKEFKVILKFLFNNDELVKQYEENRILFYNQLAQLTIDNINSIDISIKNKIEELLRPVICRTERFALKGQNIDSFETKEFNDFSNYDIKSFFKVDSFIRKSFDHTKQKYLSPLEYCKSSPFPLSFLQGYKIREYLNLSVQTGNIKKLLKKHGDIFVNKNKIENYKISFSEDEKNNKLDINGRFKSVMTHILQDKSHLFLWCPPNLSYYTLAGAFAGAENFSKTLVFSSWKLVPRMLASLVSYEVERRTIGKLEIDQRKYFQTPRQPSPQIRFSQKNDKITNRTNYCIFFPFSYLAQLVDPRINLINENPNTFFCDIKEKIKNELNTLNIEIDSKHNSSAGSDSRWYWLAPLLMTKNDNILDKELKTWLEKKSWQETNFVKTKKHYELEGNEDKESIRSSYITELNKIYNKNDIVLGNKPDDLSEYLTLIAFASPGVAAYRSLKLLNKDKMSASILYNHSLNVADSFIRLFNKPESIAAVRLSVEDKFYWQQVLRYCNDGCLSAVIDEYLHLLKNQYNSVDDIVATIVDSVNINTASINVDDKNTLKYGKPFSMRTHFAVQMGEQKSKTEEGMNRLSNIRLNFNSPFRPFLLATTSIGQEGLDFHSYCRRIVHWNLPGNPIDLEQREGRINRFKGLLIRQWLSEEYKELIDKEALDSDLWDKLFEYSKEYEHSGETKSELIPFWEVGKSNKSEVKMERILHLLPFSKEAKRYPIMLKSLAIYRLTFGQPRQVELINYLNKEFQCEDELSKLREEFMINLCPYEYNKGENK